MCVDQFNARHIVVSRSLFLLLGIFILTISHFVLSHAPTYRAYDVVVLLSHTSTFDLSYLYLSIFIRYYGI
ncbi:hypothetical protein BHE74_00049862, partial [Ensete ventricosum]